MFITQDQKTDNNIIDPGIIRTHRALRVFICKSGNRMVKTVLRPGCTIANTADKRKPAQGCNYVLKFFN